MDAQHLPVDELVAFCNSERPAIEVRLTRDDLRALTKRAAFGNCAITKLERQPDGAWLATVKPVPKAAP